MIRDQSAQMRQNKMEKKEKIINWEESFKLNYNMNFWMVQWILLPSTANCFLKSSSIASNFKNCFWTNCLNDLWIFPVLFFHFVWWHFQGKKIKIGKCCSTSFLSSPGSVGDYCESQINPFNPKPKAQQNHFHIHLDTIGIGRYYFYSPQLILL